MVSQMRTVRFYEIVDRKSGEALEHDLPWDDVLVGLGAASMTPEQRTAKIAGDDHHGGAWMLSGFPSMLLFSRIRESYEFPDLFDRSSGSLEALELAESKGVAETTHVGFFPSNVIAMIRTQSSPGAGNLERWINEFEFFKGVERLAVQPLSRTSATERISDVEQARGVTVRMRTTAAQALVDRSPRLAEAVEVLHQKFGSVMVEMRIYTTDSEGGATESAAIMEEVEGLLALTASGEQIPGVDAAKLSYRSIETEKIDEINMMMEKLAERVEVQTIDDEGRSTRRESAAQAMMVAYGHLEADITEALSPARAPAAAEVEE